VAEHLKSNLHAGVSVRQGCPRRGTPAALLRAPSLALERLSVLEDGRIRYYIKDTDPARVMTPMQFLARLAALVTSPRQSLVRMGFADSLACRGPRSTSECSTSTARMRELWSAAALCRGRRRA
jgi:hypothetical protein